MTKFLLYSIITAIVSLMTYKTRSLKSLKYDVEPANVWNPDIDRAAKNLSGAVKIKTVSSSDPKDTDWKEFKKLRDYLQKTYPLIHDNLSREIINNNGLLYLWKGQDSSKKPVMFMAHQDVVPVAEDTLPDWKYPPFGGEIAEGFVWGRGALDIKLLLVSIMEAVETLIGQGFAPNRDTYLFFGQDEEVGGPLGANEMAAIFQERGIELEYVIDEGGIIIENILKEISYPVALIGTCEKGFANVRLTVEDIGGHASMPPRNTALGVLSKAIVKLEKHQMKTSISPVVSDFFKYIGPEMKGIKKVVLANLWLLAPLFKTLFATNQLGNALLRTTTAPTMASGSLEPNVLPQKATAVINFRIAPGETGDDVLGHIKKVVNDPRVELEMLRLENPSKVCGVDNPVYKTLEKTMYQIFPDAHVFPYLVMACTDSAKFDDVSKYVYKPGPYKLDQKELQSIHGTNERVSLENIESSIRFYMQLLHNNENLA